MTCEMKLREPACCFRYNQPRRPDLEQGNSVRVFFGPSEDCGCPEEEWEVSGVPMLIHFEPDGTGEAIFTPDEDVEILWTFEDVTTIDELRQVALARANDWLAGNAQCD